MEELVVGGDEGISVMIEVRVGQDRNGPAGRVEFVGAIGVEVIEVVEIVMSGEGIASEGAPLEVPLNSLIGKIARFLQKLQESCDKRKFKPRRPSARPARRLPRRAECIPPGCNPAIGGQSGRDARQRSSWRPCGPPPQAPGRSHPHPRHHCAR